MIYSKKLIVITLSFVFSTLSIAATVVEDKAAEAVEAAQKFRGITLNVTWNKGLMAKEVLLYSGPLWEKLTGIKINVVEQMIPDMYPII